MKRFVFPCLLALAFACGPLVGCSSGPDDSEDASTDGVATQTNGSGEVDAPPFGEPRPKIAPGEVTDDNSARPIEEE